MDPILQDDDPLIALSEEDSAAIEKSESMVFLGDYENRVLKQRRKSEEEDDYENELEKKMIR